MWEIVARLIQNAFFKAILPGLDHDIADTGIWSEANRKAAREESRSGHGGAEKGDACQTPSAIPTRATAACPAKQRALWRLDSAALFRLPSSRAVCVAPARGTSKLLARSPEGSNKAQ
jgi:hypothetical protein